MSVVADRYAKALLDLAISSDAVDAYQKDLTIVSEIYEAANGLKAFLLSPQKSLRAKKIVLMNTWSETIQSNILHLLMLLLDKRRMEILPDISTAYLQMADNYRNILNITVITASPLDAEQTKRITNKFQSLHHGTAVKISVVTDNTLIGGIKVIIGDKLYDGTVKGKLSKLHSTLILQ